MAMVRSWSSASVSVGIAAHLDQARLAATRRPRPARPSACRARRQRAAFDILRDDIFQRLPAGDHVDAVADLGIARHRADLGSPNQRTSREIVSGSNCVSASSATTISPLARATPVLSAFAIPPETPKAIRIKQ